MRWLDLLIRFDEALDWTSDDPFLADQEPPRMPVATWAPPPVEAGPG
jgi:hypothetical protein